MKVKTLQIVWHARQAVYALDFHPSGVLATGGGDNDVKVRSGCCSCAALRPATKAPS